MDAKTKELVVAVWQDARKTWSSLTLAWLMEEAERQLAGERPTGGPGVFLAEYLIRAKEQGR